MAAQPSKRLAACALALLALSSSACTSRSSLSFGDPSSLGEENVPPAAPPGPIAPQIRMLSSREYRNSVKSILDVEINPGLEFGARRNGFETSAEGLMDEGLLLSLVDEAQIAAEAYVGGKLATDYPCLRDIPPGDACVRNSIAKAGLKFFRRPLTGEEVDDFYNYYTERRGADDQHVATVLLFARFLVSPSFIYRTELGALAATGSLSRLSQFETAALVAYTLTASTPDETMLNDAVKGNFKGDVLRGHVRRLLKTSDGRNALIRFMKQWLKLDKLDDMHRNPENYSKLQSAEQAWTLKREFEMFVKDVALDGEGSLRSVLTESVTYVNRHTAHLYGVSSSSDELTRVTLDKSRRSGILTLASTMSALASGTDVNRDRPVQRGTLILEQVLCGDIGIPSGLDVVTAGNDAAKKVPNFGELTTREQFDIIMQQSDSCVSCHQQFMPFGYVLGNFNALGQFVTSMNGRPINAAVTNVPMARGRRSYDGPVAFVAELSQDERVYQCFTKQWAKYVTGNDDGAPIDDLARYFHAGFKRKRYDIKSLVEDFFAEDYLYQRKASIQ